MLLFIVCLLPLVASVPTIPRETGETSSENQIVSIENDILKSVRIVDGNHEELNLSNFPGLRALDKNAFDDVPEIDVLLLANNSLTSLPDFVFFNLTKLKKLSLSDNEISNVQNLFAGLENLQLLDISRNPIRHFRRGDLFGLTKSVKILTEGNIFWSIGTDAFVNPVKDADENPMNTGELIEERAEEIDTMLPINIRNITYQKISKDTGVKMHRRDNIVLSLESLEKDEKLTEEWIQVPINYEMNQVNLSKQDIKGFEKGWYGLRSLPIASLDLSYNNIAEITKETLNDLPTNLTYVSFRGNKVHKIRNATMENDHLRILNFVDNQIEEIEEDAFANTTKLRELYLSNNQLQNLDFAHSLPESLIVFIADRNRITSIPDRAFSQLSRLVALNLEDNKIETLQNHIFDNLRSLRILTLKSNSISTIESDAFKGPTALMMLDLRRNSVRNLQMGTFAELTALRELDLAENKLTKATFTDLPQSVRSLYLDRNEIDALERNDFVGAPKTILSLNGNRISTIARGAFNLPHLKDLYLRNNTLTTIEGDSYESLGGLRNLWLSENKISEIRKGACKNLGSLYVLDISRNPFQKLENGALHGLHIGPGSSLYIYENNLTEMQGGIFDDA